MPSKLHSSASGPITECAGTALPDLCLRIWERDHVTRVTIHSVPARHLDRIENVTFLWTP
jgi:hypothetical protein